MPFVDSVCSETLCPLRTSGDFGSLITALNFRHISAWVCPVAVLAPVVPPPHAGSNLCGRHLCTSVVWHSKWPRLEKLLMSARFSLTSFLWTPVLHQTSIKKKRRKNFFFFSKNAFFSLYELPNSANISRALLHPKDSNVCRISFKCKS